MGPTQPSWLQPPTKHTGGDRELRPAQDGGRRQGVPEARRRRVERRGPDPPPRRARRDAEAPGAGLLPPAAASDDAGLPAPGLHPGAIAYRNLALQRPFFGPQVNTTWIHPSTLVTLHLFVISIAIRVIKQVKITWASRLIARGT